MIRRKPPQKGAIPRDTTLHMIADYFGIIVEDLLRDHDEQSVTAAETVNPRYSLQNSMTSSVK